MPNEAMDRYKETIERHLLDFLPEIDPKSISLYEAMKYSLTAGGKRIRPTLLLAACEFSGGRKEAAIPYACAIEYMHTYSLIHDDLPAMDDDQLRRGEPTNHIIFGEALAILAGDGLQAAAFETMTKDMYLHFDEPAELKKRVKAAHEIVKGAGCRGMIAGQVADIEAENLLCAGEMLDYIHLTKTSAIIVAAIRAGAHMGNANPETLERLTVYGEHLGLAFQIEDDLLDILGKEEEMGKKAGADKEKKKSTYPALCGVEASRTKLMELTDHAIGALDAYDDKAEFLRNLARELAVRGK